MKDVLDLPTPIQLTPKRRRRPVACHPRRFSRILLPIDFSGPSLKAIPYALAISRQFGAHVHLLHVTDVGQQPPPTLLTLPLVPQSEWNRRFMKRLQALALKYRANSNVSALEPRTGTAYEEICAAAQELKSDLIVIATHGYTGYERAFLGSTAERVVQHSSCPVLVVRAHISRWDGAADPRTRTGFRLRRILAPMDFSECSLAGFDYAVQLARDFRAELQLVHVINPHLYPFGDQYAALNPAQLMGKAAHAAENQMRSMALEAKVRYSVRVINGSPAIQIRNAANEGVDLVVISTHGRTGLGHILIGSVAEHVVRYAHCPVLVIPARPNQATQPAQSKMKTVRSIRFG